MADENKHRIWILQVKIHKLEEYHFFDAFKVKNAVSFYTGNWILCTQLPVSFIAPVLLNYSITCIFYYTSACWTVQLPVSFIIAVVAELFNYRYLLCQCLDYFYLVFYFSLTSWKSFFLVIYVFWHVESKSDVHFSLLEPKTPYNPGKNKFPDYHGFPVPTDGNGLKMEDG